MAIGNLICFLECIARLRKVSYLMLLSDWFSNCANGLVYSKIDWRNRSEDTYINVQALYSTGCTIGGLSIRPGNDKIKYKSHIYKFYIWKRVLVRFSFIFTFNHQKYLNLAKFGFLIPSWLMILRFMSGNNQAEVCRKPGWDQ